MKPILYPIQIVTGGGRAKGFRVVKYLPWSTLPTLNQINVGKSLLHLYNRLGAAYDHFYEVLGFLSPKMRMLLQTLQKSYADSYQTGLFHNYAKAYTSMESSHNIVDAYHEDDYSKSYSHLFTNPLLGEIQHA